MLDFTFSLPTELYFGSKHIEDLAVRLKEHGAKKILWVSGQGSLKAIGLYDLIKAQLKDFTVVEHSGIQPNPTLKSVLEGREKIVQHDLDFILATGGGSVMDAAKAMAFAPFYEPEELWQRCFVKREELIDALPLACLVTLSGTGSETNGNAVVTNEATNEKWSVRSPQLRPVFALIDPEVQAQAPHDYRLATAIDIIHHALEQYFDTTPETQVSDHLLVALMKSVDESIQTILNQHETPGTRQNLAWAATLGLSFIFQQGKQGEWASHRLSYALTQRYGIIHGFALTMVIPAFLKTVYDEAPELLNERLTFLGTHWLGVTEPSAVIEALQAKFRSYGAPTTYAEAGVQEHRDFAIYEALGEPGTRYGEVGTILPIDLERATRIMQAIEKGR